MSNQPEPVVLRHRPGLVTGIGPFADLDVIGSTEKKVGRLMIEVSGRHIMLYGYYHGIKTYRRFVPLSEDPVAMNQQLDLCIEEFLRGHNLLWIRSPEELNES